MPPAARSRARNRPSPPPRWRLIPRLDVRILICVGIVWRGLTSLMRAGWTSGSDFWTLAMPQLVQGLGMPFFFIGITTLALGSVLPRETTSAAGLLSFLRTLSAAIGASIAQTVWDQRERFDRSDLVSTPNDPAGFLATLQSKGMSAEQAHAVLDRLVEVQAATVWLALRPRHIDRHWGWHGQSVVGARSSRATSPPR